MDILDRLLGHDHDTSQAVLARCRELTLAQLRQPFEIGQTTVEQTLLHMIRNLEVWTDLRRAQPVRAPADATSDHPTITALSQRFDTAYAQFAALARQVRDTGSLDATYTDILDTPPTAKTFGGTIVHVITHNMAHRGELLHMLQRLGLSNLPEGDALSWEAAARRQPE